MPSYHSVFNKKEADVKYCGIPAFEFKEKKTPTLDATKLKVKLEDIELDIIDEAIIYFRANVLFKNFNIEGDADKLLVYITVFIQKCLEKANDPNPAKAKENMKKLVDQCEYVPKTENFFNILVTKKDSEIGNLQKYSKARIYCSFSLSFFDLFLLFGLSLLIYFFRATKPYKKNSEYKLFL